MAVLSVNLRVDVQNCLNVILAGRKLVQAIQWISEDGCVDDVLGGHFNRLGDNRQLQLPALTTIGFDRFGDLCVRHALEIDRACFSVARALSSRGTSAARQILSEFCDRFGCTQVDIIDVWYCVVGSNQRAPVLTLARRRAPRSRKSLRHPWRPDRDR